MNRIERENLAEEIAEMISTFEHALWALHDNNDKAVKSQFNYGYKIAQRLSYQIRLKLD
ncbi:hypothetical protein RDJ12_01630 [Mergibacter septicus]|uniref:hypothetical protein n=1 Tax=Mergibacter septicus TaxID=221402 RepID=UPI0021C3E1F5|nr:hypothetical protein [Mergibacter septicus]UTU48096.1 hypothetical protein HLL31_04515 [Mergibacter septicus]WMR96291.1 hypothetical protein RDJ12_01630 [Mergibacter septicus]